MNTPKERRQAFLAKLDALGACRDAVKWCAENDVSLRKGWRICPRGDWLLWIAAEIGVDRKIVVSAACECARLALKYVGNGETRPLKAIETAESWCVGKATLSEVVYAADAADAAAHAAYAAYAAYAAAYAADAAYAAAHAADAAYTDAADAAADAAAHAAYAAGYAAAHAADAAYTDAADAAAHAAGDADVLKNCARIVRRHIAVEMIEAELERKEQP